MSILTQLDRPAPPTLNRFYVWVVTLLMLVLNALILLAHLSPGGGLIFICDLCLIAVVGYALYRDLSEAHLPPPPPAA